MSKHEKLGDLESGKINHEPKALTPGQAIRKHCIECVGSRQEVENCGGELIYNTGKPCPLFPYRLGKGRPSVKVIAEECNDCMGGEPEYCSGSCHLHPFRMGKNPNYKSQFRKE